MIWLRLADDELVEMPESVVELLREAAPGGFELTPESVTVVSGTKMGEPVRGLRIVASGFPFHVLLPEDVARRVGHQLGDGGVHRPTDDAWPTYVPPGL